MKKIISYILTLMICFSLLPMPAEAADEYSFSLAPSAATVTEGQTFTVDVKIGGEDFNDYSAAISYNAAHLELLSCSAGSYSDDGEGSIKLHAVGSTLYSPGTEGTSIATLRFGVKDISAAGRTTLSVSGKADLWSNAASADAKTVTSASQRIILQTSDPARCTVSVSADETGWKEGEIWGTAAVGASSSSTATSATVTRGGSTWLWAKPAAGYSFAGWKLYGSEEYYSTESYVEIKEINYDMEFTAVFVPQVYAIDLSGVSVGFYPDGKGTAPVAGQPAALYDLPLTGVFTYKLYQGETIDESKQIALNDSRFYMPEDTEKLTLTASYLSGAETKTESIVLDVETAPAAADALSRMEAAYTATYASNFYTNTSVDFHDVVGYIDPETGELMLYAGSGFTDGVMVSGGGSTSWEPENVRDGSFANTPAFPSGVAGYSEDTLIYYNGYDPLSIYSYNGGRWTEMTDLEKLVKDNASTLNGSLQIYPLGSRSDMLVIFSGSVYHYDGASLKQLKTKASQIEASQIDEERVLVNIHTYNSQNDEILIYDGKTDRFTDISGYTGDAFGISPSRILGTDLVNGSKDSVFFRDRDEECYLLHLNTNMTEKIDTTGLPSLVVAMNDAADGYIYAVTDGYNAGGWLGSSGLGEGTINYVWRTDDKGASWQLVSADNISDAETAAGNELNDDTPGTTDPLAYPENFGSIVNPVAGVTLLIGGDGTAYAIYADTTITFDSQDGSAVAPITQKIRSRVSAPASPTNGDKIFAGWYTDADCAEGKEYRFTVMPAKDITLYAKWADDVSALDGLKEDAIASLDTAYGSYSKADYTEDGWGLLTKAYEDGKTGIEATTSYDSIQTILQTAISAMAAVEKRGTITVTVSMEKFTVDGGYIIEPVKVEVPSNTKASEVITDLLEEKYKDAGTIEHGYNGAPYRITGTIASGFYLAGVYDPTFTPDTTKDQVQNYEGFLSEMDCGEDSGWMYCINGSFPGVGASAWRLNNGDVMRWQYTCIGLGADIGADNTSWGSGGGVKVADKDALIERIAEINKDKEGFFAEAEGNKAAYEAAMEVLKNITAPQTEVDAALVAIGGQAETPEERLAKAKTSAISELEAYDADDYREAEKKLLIEYRADGIEAIEAAATVEEVDKALADAKALIEALITDAEYEAIEKATDADTDKIYQSTGKYLESFGAPGVGSTGGEWIVIGLARAGYEVSSEWAPGYYSNAVQYVQENINADGQLHASRSTDNSRMILALTAIGRDVTNVGGENLLTALADLDYVKKQGINGPIWALLAFDSHDYEIPTVKSGGTQVTRDNLIDAILAAQLADGGWALTKNKADPDMTAMAIQALAPYYSSNATVKAAVDEALGTLSGMQNSIGGYSSWDTDNSESCAQVVTALTSLGIDPDKDSRFIKNGHSVLDALLAFYLDDGTFGHTLTSDIAANGMATEQAYYALASYYRLLAGKTALYDMTDVKIMSAEQMLAEVQKLIDAIGDPVTLADQKTINSAVALYNSMTAEEQAKVGEDRVKKLLAAEKTLYTLEIKNVEDLIAGIGTVTLAKESQIKAAELAYNSLTTAQKAEVSNYEVLRQALIKLDALKLAEGNKVTTTTTVGTATGTTKSVGTKSADIKLTGAETENSKAAVSLIDAIVAPADAANKLPEDAKDFTQEQMDRIIEAYKAYDALTEEEKLFVQKSDNFKAFEAILDKIGEMNHYDEATGTDLRDNDGEVLPWYIKMVVKPQTLTEDQEADLKDILGEESEVFTMSDISFVNILDGSQWHPDGIIKVKLPMVDLGSYKSAVVVHITDDGKIEIIEGKVADGYMVFETGDFSLYGIAGSMQSVDDLLGAQTMSNILPWIIVGAIALIALIAVIYMRNRNRRKDDHDLAA